MTRLSIVHLKKALDCGNPAAVTAAQHQKVPLGPVNPPIAVGQFPFPERISVAAEPLLGFRQRHRRAVRKQGVYRQNLRLSGQNLLHGKGPADAEDPGPGAPQGAHTAAAAEALSEIVADRADIGTLGAEDPEHSPVPVTGNQFQLLQLDGAGLSFHLFALAGQLVELLLTTGTFGANSRSK